MALQVPTVKRFSSILAVLLFATAALGSGWNDFVQQLGSDYSIFRASSQDIGLAHNGFVLTGKDTLIEFVETPTHILTKHIRADGTLSYYVVQKTPENVVGPLTEAAFTANGAVMSSGNLAWQRPTNPHPEVARDGQLMFLAFTFVLFGTPILFVVLLVGFIVWSYRRNRKRRPAES